MPTDKRELRWGTTNRSLEVDLKETKRKRKHLRGTAEFDSLNLGEEFVITKQICKIPGKLNGCKIGLNLNLGRELIKTHPWIRAGCLQTNTGHCI